MINLMIIWGICFFAGIYGLSRTKVAKSGEKVLIAVPWIVVAAIALLYLTPISTLERFNMISVTEGEQVSIPDGASFVLESGTSATTSNSFYISSDTTEEDLANWIINQPKSIFLYIKSGDDTLYSLDYGLVKTTESASRMASSIYECYSTAKSLGYITNDTYRVEVSVFYLERNFD